MSLEFDYEQLRGTIIIITYNLDFDNEMLVPTFNRGYLNIKVLLFGISFDWIYIYGH